MTLRRSNSRKKSATEYYWTMVALLLIAVFCITDGEAMKPSSSVGKKASRRPLLRLRYRRLEEGTDNVTRPRGFPSLHRRKNRKSGRSTGTLDTDDLAKVFAQESISPEAIKLANLLEDIETLATELDTKRPPMPPMDIPSSSTAAKASAKSNEKQKIKTVHELREAVLDNGKELKDLQLDPEAQLLVNATTQELLNHDVIELMVRRFKSGSTPGNRAPDDTARLALSIEGGGMRGAVSAGMASAIACLGLCDSFDAVYGSSAGSVIGSYMISRQMCMDVYVDILPAAKRTFVCTKRIMSALAIAAMDMFLAGVKRRAKSYASYSDSDEIGLAPDAEPAKSRFAARPGMNISFVLDGIMDPEHGIRPIDMESFQRNDAKQPLRVASSYAKNGKLYSKCFGSEHFFGEKRAVREDGKRHGLFACLEPSMTVPGATGPPVLLRTHESDEALPFFDAFCFEPLPYRSAVEEGATHVLVLCSRPEGFVPKTKQGVYENAITPLYFKSHGEPEVAEFFSRGGQQYIYLEDILTVEEGKVAGMRKEGPIPVPPPKLLYGVEADQESHELATQRDTKWKRAHIMPLKVPFGTPELATLEQEKDAVREAVKGGFAAAFDLLAPAIGLNTHQHLTGAEVAALIFPKKAGMLDEIILSQKMKVDGDEIQHRVKPVSEKLEDVDLTPSGRRRRIRERRDGFLRNTRHVLSVLARKKRQDKAYEEKHKHDDSGPAVPNLTLHGGETLLAATLANDKEKAEHLLNALPGLRSGRMPQLAANLHHVAKSHSDTEDSSTDDA